ncbi:hypothetical protein SDC9_63744 [bioreactor metagenome]|uniref:Uncharacterized protein n=1 Tax=bioreactor metagenome TaxID=1076179 RepID=A0A644XMH7_9ZZZZ
MGRGEEDPPLLPAEKEPLFGLVDFVVHGALYSPGEIRVLPVVCEEVPEAGCGGKDFHAALVLREALEEKEVELPGRAADPADPAADGLVL